MQRARLIVNPKAGPDRAAALLPLINEKLRTIVDRVDITITVDAADATLTAAHAVAEGYDALYIAGGDGTLNAALRGLVPPGGSVAPIPIGVVPLGTGNDFVKALGISVQAEAALDVLLSAVVADVDVGLLNQRPFVNTSAGGFVADVSEWVTEGLKDATGKLAYLVGGAGALLGSEPVSARVTVHCPGEPATDHRFDLRMFAVCNARYIGGGYPIAPGAAIDDGLLDAIVVCAMSRLDFLAVLQRIAAGNPEGHPGVRTFRVSAMEIEFSRPVNVNTDGEVLEATRCEYRVVHRGARFFRGPAVNSALVQRSISRSRPSSFDPQEDDV